MLRDFQVSLKQGIYNAWATPNVVNVMPTLATGGGKTTVFCDIVREYDAPALVTAHRQELVAQAALSLNRERIPHDVIAPRAVIQSIISAENETHGYSTYRYKADVRAGGVDTIIRHDPTDRWLSQVRLHVIDEGHHVQSANKWGKALALTPNARGLFPTAHAVRADGNGLGRAAAGLVDALVVGPCGRDLIARGYLTDYRLLCPPGDIDFSDLQVGPTGDYSAPKLRARTHSSKQLVGDVVKHYLLHAPGKLGITFAVDIESATEISKAYNAAGVPSEIITAQTPIGTRASLLRQFRNRRLLQLVSVDCLGEGVDVPAVEVVSLARRTASWQLYCQQIGRALRPLLTEAEAQGWGSLNDADRLERIRISSKPTAIIIDHVGNCIYHGLPDVPQLYSLDNNSSGRGRSEYMPLRTCLDCTRPYERFLLACPHCGCEPVPAGRSTPEQVDGDLIELSAETLAQMRAEISKIDGQCWFPAAAGGPQRSAILTKHHDRFTAQQALRESLQLWGGWREHTGDSTREAQKRFYLTFDIDYMSAMTLDAEKADALNSRILSQLIKHNITGPSA